MNGVITMGILLILLGGFIVGLSVNTPGFRYGAVRCLSGLALFVLGAYYVVSALPN